MSDLNQAYNSYKDLGHDHKEHHYKGDPRCPICKMPTSYVDDGEKLGITSPGTRVQLGGAAASTTSVGVFYCAADNRFILKFPGGQQDEVITEAEYVDRKTVAIVGEPIDEVDSESSGDDFNPHDYS